MIEGIARAEPVYKVVKNDAVEEIKASCYSDYVRTKTLLLVSSYDKMI